MTDALAKALQNAPKWRCGHLCLIDVPESYRKLRVCPDCRQSGIVARSSRQARFKARLRARRTG